VLARGGLAMRSPCAWDERFASVCSLVGTPALRPVSGVSGVGSRFYDEGAATERGVAWCFGAAGSNAGLWMG
jgi:hypothetical protein